MSMASRIDRIQKTRLDEPLRCLFYGPEGIGKSSLAANAEEPVFLDVEEGTGHLEVARYPLEPSFEGVLFAIEDLTHNEHPWQTLVIDTIDRLESMIWDHCCQRDRKKNIEDYGYGKGYSVAQVEWRRLISRLEALRKHKGMQIILLSHCHIKTYRNPDGEDYDRHQLSVHEKAAGLVKDWCDIVGFVHYEQGLNVADSGRPKAYATGRRLLGLARTATCDAKARLPVPACIELTVASPWAPLCAAIQTAKLTDAKELKARIADELKRLSNAELTKAVHDAIAKSGDDIAALGRYLNRLKEREAA